MQSKYSHIDQIKHTSIHITVSIAHTTFFLRLVIKAVQVQRLPGVLYWMLQLDPGQINAEAHSPHTTFEGLNQVRIITVF